MRFLIGTDGSEEAGQGLAFVRALPLRPADEVIVVAVAEIPIGFEAFAGPPTVLGWHDELRSSVLERCRTLLADQTPEAWAPARLSTAVEDGPPLRALLQLAIDHAADVVVVGPQGRGRLETLVMGSVTQGLLDAGRVPVLVARAAPARLDRVVIGIDGSPGSESALDWLTTLPIPPTVEVVAISVIPDHEGPFGRAWSDELYPKVVEAEQAAAREALDAATARLRDAELTVRSEIRTGSAKSVLVDAARAEGAGLLVVGARGLGGFDGLLLGSVSHAVAKTAPCSVAVVHRRE